VKGQAVKIPDEIVRKAWDKYCEGARDGFAMRAALQVAVEREQHDDALEMNNLLQKDKAELRAENAKLRDLLEGARAYLDAEIHSTIDNVYAKNMLSAIDAKLKEMENV
jgi:hypothetical protein